MTTNTDTIQKEAGNLAEAARGMISATADAAGDTGAEVLKQIDAAVDRGKEVYENVRETAVDGAKSANEIVHEQPYKTLAVAFGFGTLLGFLLARR
jgi:ElaB/YqjD/DUF883 family membrane-anchored ribosome-binding protein